MGQMEKTLVLYYSYTGNTKKRAGEVAEFFGADLCEVKDKARPGTVKAYVLGSFAAMRMRPGDVEPIEADLAGYDKFVLMAPIWAGYPAPPFHNMVQALPVGKKVEAWLVSGSGSSSARVKVATEVHRAGCDFLRYVDVGPSFNLDYFDTAPPEA